MEKIIAPVDKDLVMSELTHDKLLRHANKGDNEVYIVDAFNAPSVMKEIGRLREIAFRDAGGGTGLACDIDEFDTMESPCQQLIVWDPHDREIVGGYRFILGENIWLKDGVPNIATSHMFRFSDKFLNELLPSTLELGRSFVATTHQSTKSHSKALYTLDNLWDGLGALTVIYPQIKYLFGKVTMYPDFHRESREMLLGFIYRHFPDPDSLVTPIAPLPSIAASPEIQNRYTGDYKEDMRILSQFVRAAGYRIPPLVNAYMSLSPTMRSFGTAVNREFGDVEETGILISLDQVYEDKKARHISSFTR